MKTYSAKTLDPKAERPPEYLNHLTYKEICNYFFNWNTDLEIASFDVINLWFREKRKWVWVED